MTDNPFDALGAALGGGGLDMNALMQQAMAMQEQLQTTQQQLADAEVTGSVAGGAVTVTINGVGDLLAVQIGADAGELDEIGDLVVAAYRDAKAQADAMANQALGPLAGGLGGALPGGPAAPAPGKLGF